MNLLRNSLLLMTIVPVVIAAGCGGGSASSTASSTTPSQPSQPSQPTQPTQSASNVAISSPASGASVSSPFTVTASATTCNSQTVTSIGYALDGGLTYTTSNGTTLSAQVTASAGAHTVNIVANGSNGASCNASESVLVTAPTQTGSDLAISSPTKGATVTSPFKLSASGTTCNGQAITSMGYAVDSGTTTVLTGSSIASSVTAAAGAHTVYVKAWGNSGVECDANVPITVSAPTTGSNSLVPSNAISVNNLEARSNWSYNHDPATGASSSGTMALLTPPTPLNSSSGMARQFNSSFTNSGGEIYYVSFGADTAPMNFFWDGWVYVDNSISSVANLELDMNQVISNGDTIIYGFQCDGYSGTWDYTENSGTVVNHSAHWLHSSAPCDVRTWTPNSWHHIQISYSRDNSGNVTYHSVWLDGNQAPINKTVPSEFALGWGTTLLTNFQIDGRGTGSNTIYLDNLTISRW